MRAGRRRARRPHGSDFRRRRRRKKLEAFSSFKRSEVEQPAASEAAEGGKRRPTTTNCPRANRRMKREAREGFRGGKPVNGGPSPRQAFAARKSPLLAPHMRLGTVAHGSPACICLPLSQPCVCFALRRECSVEVFCDRQPQVAPKVRTRLLWCAVKPRVRGRGRWRDPDP